MSAIDDRIREIEAAPDAEEALRERVASALYRAHRDPEEFWTARWEDAYGMHNEYRRLADAAIAVMTTPAEVTS